MMHPMSIVEENIELPMKITRKPKSLPYDQLEVGQSFWTNKKHINTTDWSKRTGFKFTSRAELGPNGEPGRRVWRIA